MCHCTAPWMTFFSSFSARFLVCRMWACFPEVLMGNYEAKCDIFKYPLLRIKGVALTLLRGDKGTSHTRKFGSDLSKIWTTVSISCISGFPDRLCKSGLLILVFVQLVVRWIIFTKQNITNACIQMEYFRSTHNLTSMSPCHCVFYQFKKFLPKFSYIFTQSCWRDPISMIPAGAFGWEICRVARWDHESNLVFIC